MRRALRLRFLSSFLFLAIILSVTAAAADNAGEARDEKRGSQPQSVLAPGWAPLAYAAPTPGTYDLPPLGDAADGQVLDTAGRPRRLHDFLGDKVVVLSFIYRACPDVNGCPLANYVLSAVQRRVSGDPTLRDDVRLVSLSFDPRRDRPEAMARHAAGLVAEGADWAFLTTESERPLAPILEAYGQSVRTEYDENGQALGTIAHVLRVYLIDRA
jgi:cytochrome c peroxidase